MQRLQRACRGDAWVGRPLLHGSPPSILSRECARGHWPHWLLLSALDCSGNIERCCSLSLNHQRERTAHTPSPPLCCSPTALPADFLARSQVARLQTASARSRSSCLVRPLSRPRSPPIVVVAAAAAAAPRDLCAHDATPSYFDTTRRRRLFYFVCAHPGPGASPGPVALSSASRGSGILVSNPQHRSILLLDLGASPVFALSHRLSATSTFCCSSPLPVVRCASLTACGLLRLRSFLPSLLKRICLLPRLTTLGLLEGSLYVPRRPSLLSTVNIEITVCFVMSTVHNTDYPVS